VALFARTKALLHAIENPSLVPLSDPHPSARLRPSMGLGSLSRMLQGGLGLGRAEGHSFAEYGRLPALALLGSSFVMRREDCLQSVGVSERMVIFL
jgi:hypothetical protein